MNSRDEMESELSSVEDMAAYWVMRLSASDCTPEDRFAFEAWKCENPRHEKVFEQIRRGNAFGDRLLSDPRMQALIDEARECGGGWNWRRARPFAAVVAASLMVMVGASVLFGSFADRVWHAPAAAAAEIYETAVGERSTVTLSDGSVVTLNTNSAMEVRFTSAEREILLARGQGYFEVAKDADRPFIVSAGDKRIMALGTIFDVHYGDDKRVRVTLVEGVVNVNNAPLRQKEGVMAADKGVRLHPGEQLFASAQNTQVETVDLDETTSWRTGKLVFRDRLLSEVVAEMNRYSNQKLTLRDDARLKQLRVSGVFTTGRASTFVNALEDMAPVEAQRTGRSELALVWRE